MAALRWATEYCPSAKFIMKGQDRTLFNVGKTLQQLRKITVSYGSSCFLFSYNGNVMWVCSDDKTRPSRPLGAPCGSSNVCLTNWSTDRPTDTTGYRSASTHLKKQRIISIKQCQGSQTHCWISLSSPKISWVEWWCGKLKWIVIQIPHSKSPRLIILINATLHFALVSLHGRVPPILHERLK